MKRVVCMLVMMLMAATFGMAQKAKTDDAGLRTIIQRATAKAAMEASVEWKWEEFLGLAQIDRSLIKNYPYSDFLCYENDTRTFIALTHYDQMEEYYQGAGEVKWFKVGEVPQYRRFDPRTGVEQRAGVADEAVERLLKNGKCIKLEDFKSPIPVAERKAKIERMKQQEQEEEREEKLAGQERAHKAMLLSLSIANGAGLSLESTEDLVHAFGVYGWTAYGGTYGLPNGKSWTRVLYAPSKRSLWVYYNKNSWIKIDFDKETADVKYTYSGRDKNYEIPKNFYDYMVVYDKSVSGGVYRIAKSLNPASQLVNQHKKFLIERNMLLEEINKEWLAK